MSRTTITLSLCLLCVLPVSFAAGGRAAAQSPPCADPIPTNPCIPGGGGKSSDCNLEFLTSPVPELRRGVPTNRVTCYEGDPRCDSDPDLDNAACTLRFALCINNTDARLPDCALPGIDSFEVKLPNASRFKDVADELNLAVLESVAHADLGLTVVRKDVVEYPGATNRTLNLCTPDFDILVPLRQSAIGEVSRGKKTLRLRTVSSAGKRDADTLLLQCRPSTCGNGAIEADHETCDDSNRLAGDGCAPWCLIETPIPTPTATSSPVATGTPTASFTPVPTTTSTPTRTVTASPSSTPTRSPSATPTRSPSSTATRSPSRTPTRSPSATPTSSSSPTRTPSASPTRTPTASPTWSSSPTRTPSTSPTPTPSSSPTDTPSASPTRTPSSSPTSTSSASPTRTPTSSPTSIPTASPSSTPTNTPLPSQTPTRSPSVTNTATATFTDTPTRTPTMSPTPTTPQPCNPDSESYTEPAFYRSLAYRWAPIIIQDTASSWNADFIGRIDYDGDWRTNNNWNNLPSAGIAPYIYYNVLETSTHWFIHYHTYHPRDWNNAFFGTCGPDPDCHENDTENMLVMIQKDGSTYGRFRMLQTRAHNDFYQYALPGDGVSNGSGPSAEDIDNDPERGFSLFTDTSVGVNDPRPAVYVESKGHGICDWWDNNGPIACSHPDDQVGSGGNDGIMYYPSETIPASVPPNPEGGQWFNFKSAYNLISLWDDVWVLRSCIGNNLFLDAPFTYAGVAGNGSVNIGGALDGDDHADDAGTMWWAQKDDTNNLPPGDWTFDPADTVVRQLTFSETVDTTYQYNPFLGIP